MQEIIAVTSDDFSEQHLVIDGTALLANAVRNPLDTLDDRLMLYLAQLGQDPFVPAVQREYDGARVLSRLSGAYPNALFSHYLLASTLRKQNVAPEHLVDMGCGCGYLGNYGARVLGAKKVTFADANADALRQSLHSLRMASEYFALREDLAAYQLDDALVWLRQGWLPESAQGLEADVAVAAPNYIPGVCEVFPQCFEVYSWSARQIGATLYLVHAATAQDMAIDAARHAGMEYEVLAKRHLPLIPYESNVVLHQAPMLGIHTGLERDIPMLEFDVARIASK